jgi:FtsP/CotA-like multicopper oxidase with cupredoxin domain
MPKDKSVGLPNRREFIERVLTTTSAIAVTAALPAADAQTPAPVPTCPANTAAPNGVPQVGGELLSIAEIRSGPDRVLRATITASDENRSLWIVQANTLDKQGFNVTTCRENEAMRFFSGAPSGGKPVWPVAKGVPGPGPTLRARVGDTVQITLLNHVDVKNFPNTLDLAEQGKSAGCDASNTLLGATGQQSRREVYPNGDQEPDCFHGSSTVNLHFHGFHVSPNTVADNVLVQVRPALRDPKTNQPLVTEASVRKSFDEVFAMAEHGHTPQKWEDLPKAYRDMQEQMLRAYDKTIQSTKLWPANEAAIKAGEWPQYYIGAYPNTFKITEHNMPPAPGMPPAKAGHAPGTHWYHAHKHGSVSLNIFNGMAGAFIVEGDYDDKLRAFYGAQGLEEKVLLIQQLLPALPLQMTPAPNGARQGTGFGGDVFVNGQPKPVVTMRPGQVQLWRILNTTPQTLIQLTTIDPANPPVGDKPAFQWRQTAQDGIQFSWTNYARPGNRNPKLMMAPANRVDLLVQAPLTPGMYDVHINPLPGPLSTAPFTLMSVRVAGQPMQTPQGFPETASDFPLLPEFLRDIQPAEIQLRRDVTFDTHGFNNDGQRSPGFARAGFPSIRGSVHTIDGGQFENNVINKVMLLDSSEEWTLLNTTQAFGPPPIDAPPPPPPPPPAPGAAPAPPPPQFPIVPLISHPFHIHVNPFQVVEIFDPVTMEKPLIFDKDYVWYDTIAIPPSFNYLPDGKTPRRDKDGKQVYVPGYVKIRSRFVDFAGIFVLHCHILGHEDRGMMQLVEVVNNKTLMEHYH